jgi:hypothetical protein
MGGLGLSNKQTSFIKPLISSALTKSLIGSKQPTKAPPNQQQLTAAKISASKPSKPPAKMNVAQLTPITKTAAPKVVAAPVKVNKIASTPIKSASGLSSILANKQG